MPRKPNIHLTAEEILQAAKKLLINNGYEGLSMRKLAAKLDCQAPSIYYYYENKNAIIEKLIEEGFGILIEIDQKTAAKPIKPLERIEEFCRNYIDFAFDNPGYYYVMYSLKLNSVDLKEKIYEQERILGGVLIETVKEGIDDGSVKVQNPLLLITYCWCVLHGLITTMAKGRIDSRFETDTIKETVLNVLFNSYQIQSINDVNH